jgi:hypothetical protein
MDNAEQYALIKEVPTRFGEGAARISLSYLLKHADKVEEWFRPNGGSKYRAHFDDGVYKGSFVFTFRQRDLTPLTVYLQCASTGWPGLSVGWLEEVCAQRMKAEMEAAHA